MKKLLSLLIFLFTIQVAFAQKERQLKKVIELKMPDEGGSNGAAVAWHPTLKRYYACMAGNATFPMSIFDATGKRLSKDSIATGFDVRGFWWSPQLQTFCANGYDEYGWVSYKLDKKGYPTDTKQLFEGMHQPGEHSVGAFNSKTNELYFLNGQNVLIYPLKNGEPNEEGIRLHVGSANEDEALLAEYEEEPDELEEDYNKTLVYTGKPKSEFSLLNIYENRIETYDKASGYMTEKLILPEGTAGYNALNFAYANGIYWLFNKELRKWTGFK